MLGVFLKSSFIFLIIPIITLAIEPSNPIGICDRFIGEQEKAECVAKTSKSDLDWYAASACSLQQEDKNFHACINEIQQATFNPEALEICAKDSNMSDSQRFLCIRKVKNRDYTRVQMKKCADNASMDNVIQCLGQNSQPRKPASVKNPAGFQPLDVRK
ncbi:MAG: hypothetical protein H7326_07680 [Bdellovibrionaceae bacterium]|nr:hypothetical protein [Pseudobdellovibrionaceae bacterium]